MSVFGRHWEELNTNGAETVYQLIDDRHPLDFYAGMDVNGDRLLVLLTRYEMPKFPQSQSIAVTCSQRTDDRTSLLFRLKNNQLIQLFAHVCEDMVEASRNCEPSKAGVFLLYRFNRWLKLLERGYTGLDENVLRGLTGELSVLKTFISKYGAAISVKAWTGPESSDQDYRFSHSWYEVKTTRPGASVIYISSLEQLDVEYEGKLAVVSLDKTTGTQPGCFTICDLVAEIREMLKDEPEAAERFDYLLMEGMYIDLAEYRQHYYCLQGIRFFNVTERFPRLKRTDVPIGIRNVKYELELSSLTEFETDDYVGV